MSPTFSGATTLVATLAIMACGSAEAPATPDPAPPPLITGTIVGNGFLQGTLLVVATPFRPAGSCSLSDWVNVRFAGRTVRRRSGAAASEADLVPGEVVSVWTTGVILDSCPAIVSASVAVIEDSPRAAADSVAGHTYVVRTQNGAALPTATEWRQGKEMTCTPGTLAGASLRFIPGGSLEMRVQSDTSLTGSLLGAAYAQPHRGLVESEIFAAPAIARRDSLFVSLRTVNPLLCAPSGQLNWVAVRRDS